MKALVTGAAAGLGKSITNGLADSGYTVIALDRDEDGLDQITGPSIQGLLCDLSDVNGLESRMDELAGLGPYSLVILNAGISATGKFENIPAQVHQNLLAVNTVAPMILASGLAARNAYSPAARLVFVSSLACKTGYPGAASYAASKNAIAIYAKSIRKPFRKRGVSIMTVFPGPIRTGHAAYHAPSDSDEKNRMHPDEMAAKIIRATEAGKRHYYPGMAAKLSAMAGSVAPGYTTGLMRKLLYEKLSEEKW
ncbi:MAG: SDR family NAD(P)-dependent oxidoreductase [Rhizobiaceae bacterium]